MLATVRARRPRIALLSALLGSGLALGGARAEDDGRSAPAGQQASLVKQANAPISSILQLRVQDSYLPEFADVRGQANTLTTSVTMPLPAYRLFPRPQLSLLSMPTAVTTPGGTTGFGDVRFLDIAILDARPTMLWGVGPTFVFPTASERTTGQGKWQSGPAAAIAFFPGRWLIGALAQNPISFAGDRDREDTNALVLQPFVTYQLRGGWFVRSQPQIVFDWRTSRQIVPLDLGAGRVFHIGRQQVSCFVEPFWNVSVDGPTPRYGVTFGLTLLYPDFWRRRA